MPRNADPYRTLGLSRGASLDEVKRAYRRLAKANHPDAAGPGALPRFLAIHAAYEQIAGGPAGPAPGTRPGRDARSGPTARRGRPSEADPDRADSTRQASGGGSRGYRPGATPGPRPGPAAGGARDAGRDRDHDAAGSGPGPRPGRGKATLGSTSYDGADTGPFEPDWAGASWYGTTSGTYWTINPKEYADPRKHGPEYQARARRAAGAKGDDPAEARHAGPGGDRGRSAERSAGAPGHTTSSWWESTSGPAATPEPDGTGAEPMGEGADPAPAARTRAAGDPAPDPAPDPARAAIDLGRALMDPHSGGLRGRVVRAFLAWLPIALGAGWLVGEVSGCGRFAATCDPSVPSLLVVGQGLALAGLLLLPEVAALAAGAALALVGAAAGASLILSATGTAADEGSRRAVLGALLVLAWLIGLGVAVVRRIRFGPRPAGPVS
jgi:hypothetical protein